MQIYYFSRRNLNIQNIKYINRIQSQQNSTHLNKKYASHKPICDSLS